MHTWICKLDKTDNFLGKHRLPKLTQEETNSPTEKRLKYMKKQYTKGKIQMTTKHERMLIHLTANKDKLKQ